MNIENKKQIATILLAVGLGLVAAYLTSQYVQNNVSQQTKILAKEYQKKNASLIQEIELVKGELKRVRAQQKELARRQAEIKRTPVQVAATGGASPTPVVQMEAFSGRTPPGKRALTISIDSLSAVGGLINPGDFVDIIGHLEIPKDEEEGDTNKITTILFQNIQVLSVGTNFKPIENPPEYASQQRASRLNVTFALTPEEASLLSFVKSKGDIQLTLRPPAEEDTEIVQVASWDALADFVLEQQGTELYVPKSQVYIEAVGGKEGPEVKPVIEIFRSSQESSF